MPKIGITITNLSQIKSAFSKAPVLTIQELDKAIRKSIFTIQRDAQINTPVATGRLRASFRSSFSPLRGLTETGTNYALFVHEGTRYMKARPFLLDAVKSDERIINDNFKQAVDNVLTQIGRESD